MKIKKKIKLTKSLIVKDQLVSTYHIGTEIFEEFSEIGVRI